MSNLKQVGINDFMTAFNKMKEFHQKSGEPLPVIKNYNSIDSALKYPFQQVFGQVLYRGFYLKASCYFYTFCKGHILENGNKRSGVICVALFYELNEREIGATPKEMYEMAKFIANSNPSEKRRTIESIAIALENCDKRKK